MMIADATRFELQHVFNSGSETMPGIVYKGRHANKESGRKMIQKFIPGIGDVHLEFEEERCGFVRSYKMYDVHTRKYEGFARHYTQGNWTFDQYPHVQYYEPVGSLPVGSPYAVNVMLTRLSCGTELRAAACCNNSE
jgi:hypothetical protein